MNYVYLLIPYLFLFLMTVLLLTLVSSVGALVKVIFSTFTSTRLLLEGFLSSFSARSIVPLVEVKLSSVLAHRSITPGLVSLGKFMTRLKSLLCTVYITMSLYSTSNRSPDLSLAFTIPRVGTSYNTKFGLSANQYLVRREVTTTTTLILGGLKILSSHLSLS
jgi:hypothetical protein